MGVDVVVVVVVGALAGGGVVAVGVGGLVAGVRDGVAAEDPRARRDTGLCGERRGGRGSRSRRLRRLVDDADDDKGE